MKNRGYYDTRTALKPSQAAAMRRFFPQKIKISKDVVESVIDVGSGFFLAIIIQLTIFPFFDLHPTIFVTDKNTGQLIPRHIGHIKYKPKFYKCSECIKLK